MTVQMVLLIAVASSIFTLCVAVVVLRVRKRMVERKWERLSLEHKLSVVEIRKEEG